MFGGQAMAGPASAMGGLAGLNTPIDLTKSNSFGVPAPMEMIQKSKIQPSGAGMMPGMIQGGMHPGGQSRPAMSMGGMMGRNGDKANLNKPQNQPSQIGMAPK